MRATTVVCAPVVKRLTPPPAFDGRVLLSWTNTAGCGAACIPVATHAYNEQHHDYMAQAKLREGRSPAARAPACRHP
jgi:hypothetical protein